MLYECGLVVRGEAGLMHLEAGDGSYVKAYQHSGGAASKEPQALGKSCAGIPQRFTWWLIVMVC
ncbi:MAG: hypothetical protein K2P83_05465 [Nitrosomonas sp.]|nr:hypothetical protein [Nitrosomonas sp.]